MNLDLKGKKALVFGSSSGIGKAIAESLIQEGAKVALCARNEDRLKETAEKINASCFDTCDLSQPGSAGKVTNHIIEKLGGLHILVANTGGPEKNNFLQVSESQWRHDFQSLWLSVVDSLHAALPLMKEQKYGRILLITSVAAKEPMEGLTTSNGLRAGLAGLVKSIANETASFGITCNLLLPGFTNTPRIEALNLSEKTIQNLVPAGRLGQPHEIADLAAFLASKKADYITGQSIAVDGGYLKSH